MDTAGLCYLSSKAHKKSLVFLITRTGPAQDTLASLPEPNQQFPWKMMIYITSASLSKLGSAGRWEEEKHGRWCCTQGTAGHGAAGGEVLQSGTVQTNPVPENRAREGI